MVSNAMHFDEDNLIYNRFDLIYPDGFERYIYDAGEENYELGIHVSGGIAELDIWGKELPYEVMAAAVRHAFLNRDVYAVELTRSRNNYQDMLMETEDIRIPLPDTFEKLIGRMKRKGRATIKREFRCLEDSFGSLRLLRYHGEIPDELVDDYFGWKEQSHGREYGLEPQEYLKIYHVTDAMLLKAGSVNVAVSFCCITGEIAYLENFSYNPALKDYSPGTLIYVKLLEDLIKKGCRYLYLGGGDYLYKRRFGAEVRKAYTGKIYRDEIFEWINRYFDRSGIKTIAVYGLGGCYKDFSRIVAKLNVNLVFGIDRFVKHLDDLKVYEPDMEFPHADMALITLNEKDETAWMSIERRFRKVAYWNDLLNESVLSYTDGRKG